MSRNAAQLLFEWESTAHDAAARPNAGEDARPESTCHDAFHAGEGGSLTRVLHLGPLSEQKTECSDPPNSISSLIQRPVAPLVRHGLQG